MAAVSFPPLIAGAEGLERPPLSAADLRQRMAQVYGVAADCVLPVRGKWHGVALALRHVAHTGGGCVAAPRTDAFQRLARISRLSLGQTPADATFIASPSEGDGRALTAATGRELARSCAPGLLVVDESLIEFADASSIAGLTVDEPNLVVLRDLGAAYGLAGEPCAALIASAGLITALEELLEPEPLSTPAIRLALSALDPARSAAYSRRFDGVRAEKVRIIEALRAAANVSAVDAGEGPFVFITPRDSAAARREIARHAAIGEWRDADCFRLRIGAQDVNDRGLAALGAPTSGKASRRADVVRETLETTIVLSVDLDREGGSDISTGVGFYDHMLAQVAAHGGFSLALHCRGDLEIDAHHTIEDCALALGQALKEALGTRRGIGRFGFVLPMDEAEAKVSVDLGGRPYLVFDASFSAPLIGEYPVEMTEHVFRSLSQSLGASIHVAVKGENDHHKTEACFKAFGRALRQAIRVEGEHLPSTKGVIA